MISTWLLLLGVVIRPEHVTRPTLVLVTVIALATQVPLAVTLEVELHADTAGPGAEHLECRSSRGTRQGRPGAGRRVDPPALGRHALTPKDYLFLGSVSGLAFGASEVVHYFTVNGLAQF